MPLSFIYNDPKKRHDFAFLFDITNGNPNGDPDAGNLPRTDPETMRGLVTDVSVKRKIRDYVDISHGDQERFAIYIQSKGIALNDFSKRAHEEVFGDESEEITGARRGKGSEQGKNTRVEESAASRQNPRRAWMCDHFYDIRTFGAVLSTGDYPAGQVRGPIQLTFSQSIDPIFPQDIAITRVAVTKLEEGKKTTTTMGRKAFVPYGLYLGYGFFVPHFARQTGFSGEDLELFWTALQSIWDMDRSANRGMLALHGLYIFSHENALGNAPAHTLLERIHVKKRFDTERKEEVQIPRHFSDYIITVDDSDLPDGVTLTRLVQ